MWHHLLSPPNSEWPAKANGDSFVRASIAVLQRSICPGYGWIFPAPGNVLNLGVGVFRDTRRPPRIGNLRTCTDLRSLRYCFHAQQTSNVPSRP